GGNGGTSQDSFTSDGGNGASVTVNGAVTGDVIQIKGGTGGAGTFGGNNGNGGGVALNEDVTATTQVDVTAHGTSNITQLGGKTLSGQKIILTADTGNIGANSTNRINVSAGVGATATHGVAFSTLGNAYLTSAT